MKEDGGGRWVNTGQSDRVINIQSTSGRANNIVTILLDLAKTDTRLSRYCRHTESILGKCNDNNADKSKNVFRRR